MTVTRMLDDTINVMGSYDHARNRIEILERVKNNLTAKIAEIDEKIAVIKRDAKA